MSRSNPSILIADDDVAIRESLARELALSGFAPLQAADGAEALALYRKEHPDLVITDLAMPRVGGLEVIEGVRSWGTTPVIVLTVRGEEEEKVRALDSGADDYVTKPFSLRELLARVRAQVRRTGAASPVLRFPDLEIDTERRIVMQGGREVRLTPTELGILKLLARRAGRPVTIAQIIRGVWDGSAQTSADTVRVHVGALRRKLEPDPANPRYIGTEPWVGYRFLVDPIEEPVAAAP